MTRISVCGTIQPSGAAELRRLVAQTMLMMLLIVTTACTTVLIRAPVPEDDIEAAAPYGIRPNIVRVWGDSLSEDASKTILGRWAEIVRQGRAAELAAGGPIPEVTLALSGGGPDGAFGAGLLNGWTARGDRPEFTLVTGISTGAIVAVFAFLGPEYDDELKEIYTTYTTEQLLVRSLFSAFTGGTALTDTRGYRGLINRYIDDDAVRRLAEEHARGRALLIGTTNLDAARPVVWSIGSIAASGHPQCQAADPGYHPGVRRHPRRLSTGHHPGRDGRRPPL